jgi:hypothetical protein
LEFLFRAVRQEEEVKDSNREVKLSLFVDDKILCLKDLKHSTKKLYFTNTFDYIAGF